MMPIDIPALPAIPEGLRLAAAQGSLVPFVGAGLSKLAGCPDWKEFAARSLGFFIDRGRVDYSYLEQLSALGPRVKLSLARGLEAEHGEKIDYSALLAPRGAAEIARGRRAYDALSRLAKVFITTNYDDWLDTVKSDPGDSATTTPNSSAPVAISRNVYYRRQDLTIDKLDNPNTVLHIHGSVKDPRSMVVTTSDYLDHYANHAQVGGALNENGYLVFLESLFRLKNVLFIGYGLEELEILEYVVQKARDAKARLARVEGKLEEPRHYMLQGFYSHQRDLAASLSKYYSDEIGVRLLPFSKDKKDWEQLVDVIEHLAEEVPTGSTLALRKRAELRELI